MKTPTKNTVKASEIVSHGRAANPFAYRDKMRRRRVKRRVEVLAGSRLSPRAARVQMAAPLCPYVFPASV